MAALLTSISNGRRKGEVGGPFLTCVNLPKFEGFKLKKKKCSNYSDCEMRICFQVECCVWERFSFKASGSHLPCVVEQVKSLPLFANKFDNPSHRLSLNDSNNMEHIQSELIRDKENNHRRWRQEKKTHRTMPSFTFLPSSSSQQIEHLVDCDNISEFQHSSSEEPRNFAILGTDLRPTWSQANFLAPVVTDSLQSPTWSPEDTNVKVAHVTVSITNHGGKKCDFCMSICVFAYKTLINVLLRLYRILKVLTWFAVNKSRKGKKVIIILEESLS